MDIISIYLTVMPEIDITSIKNFINILHTQGSLPTHNFLSLVLSSTKSEDLPKTLSLLEQVTYIRDNRVYPIVILDDDELQVVKGAQGLPPLTTPYNHNNSIYSNPYPDNTLHSCLVRHSGVSDKDDTCLDLLQTMNNIPLKLNPYALENCKQKSPKEIGGGFMARKNQEEMNKAQLSMQEEFKDKTFYMPWFYDSRGRFYDFGYLIKIQGTEYQKSVIQFADEEVINDE